MHLPETRYATTADGAQITHQGAGENELKGVPDPRRLNWVVRG